MNKRQVVGSAFSLVILALGMFPISTFAEVAPQSLSTEEQAVNVQKETQKSRAETLPGVEETANDKNVNPELQKALDAGFTKEQYDQIMQIPKVPAAVDRSELIRATLPDKQAKVVAKAKEQIGKPYAWGAQGPDSFDCGGLVRYVFKQAVGMDIPMGTTNQEKMGTEVSLNALQPGDLVFYGSRGATYHVAIYIGNGQILHAPQPGQTVCIIDMKWFPPQFARRLLTGDPEPPKKQTTVTEVSKTVMVNRDVKELDTLPWGMKGYVKLGTTVSHEGKVISLTQDSGSYAFSPELKSWIDKRALVEVIKTNQTGTLSAGYQINPLPWYRGVPITGYTKDYAGQKVTVTAKNGGYYYVPNLGWIDNRAFNQELRNAVDSTPNTNITTDKKNTMTEMDKTATVIVEGNGSTIDTLPWGVKGFSNLSNAKNHQGETVKITQEWGAYGYSYSPELKGWIDKRGLIIK